MGRRVSSRYLDAIVNADYEGMGWRTRSRLGRRYNRRRSRLVSHKLGHIREAFWLDVARANHVAIPTMALFQVSLCHTCLMAPLSDRTLLTLCPSPSTLHQLEEQSFRGVRLWPRGVDVAQYSPNRRSSGLREIWGVHGIEPSKEPEVFTGEIKQHLPAASAVDEMAKLDGMESFIGYNFQGRKASLPLTPPESPAIMPLGSAAIGAGVPRSASPSAADERCVLLYIGRM